MHTRIHTEEWGSTYHSWSSTGLRARCATCGAWGRWFGRELEIDNERREGSKPVPKFTKLRRSALSDGGGGGLVLCVRTASTGHPLPRSVGEESVVAARGDGGGGSRQSHFLDRAAHRSTICDPIYCDFAISFPPLESDFSAFRALKLRESTA